MALAAPPPIQIVWPYSVNQRSNLCLYNQSVNQYFILLRTLLDMDVGFRGLEVKPYDSMRLLQPYERQAATVQQQPKSAKQCECINVLYQVSVIVVLQAHDFQETITKEKTKDVYNTL